MEVLNAYFQLVDRDGMLAKKLCWESQHRASSYVDDDAIGLITIGSLGYMGNLGLL
jgi:hypothetical protein